MNVQLMEATMARILAEPHNLDMDNWACGTTRCFAGHAVEIAGAQIDSSSRSVERCLWHGKERVIRSLAKELLDLDGKQAYELFHCDVARVEDLHLVVKDMIEAEQAGGSI